MIAFSIGVAPTVELLICCELLLFLAVEVFGGFLNIRPRGGEGVKARFGPHGLVIHDHGAGAAGQRREAVGLAARGEGREDR